MSSQTSYTRAMTDLICDRIAAGDSLRKVCESTPGCPNERSVRRWAMSDIDGFAERFESARNLGLEGLLDLMVAIAPKDYSIIDNGTKRVDNAAVQQARLLIDTIKWKAAKQMPGRYGDKIVTEITGANGGPVKLEAVRNSLAEKLARIAQSRTDQTADLDGEPERAENARIGVAGDDQDEPG